MEKTLTEICEYLNNYFVRERIEGEFVITGGTLVVPALKEGQYFCIVGSILNDGVYKYPATGMKDETFKGVIKSMAVPTAVIDLSLDVTAWVAQYGTAGSPAMSPFSSESFGNYSYSKAVAGSGTTGAASWQSAFAARLAPYRKLRNI